MACHHSRPTHWRGMRSLNAPGPAPYWLGFLGSHSRPPKREEFSHLGGSQGPEQVKEGQREGMSWKASPRLRGMRGVPLNGTGQKACGQDLPKAQGG